jgi:RNA-directed DNA polymerase
MRTIAQPAKEVKAVQRWLIANELKWMPLHSAATAYVPGSTIRENARLHLHNRFLLKVDFANFFPSIKETDLRAHIDRYARDRYSQSEIEFLCRILLWRAGSGGPLEVCIGAPSSPILSNSVMYDFDVVVDGHCRERGIVYSRYADDLALSTNEPHVLESLTDFLRDALMRIAYPALKLNEAKTVFTSKKFRRSVTGLILANQGYVSLGRERKRVISATVHRFSVGLLNGRERAKLAGMLAFVQDVEPAFLKRLEARYSLPVLNSARGMKLTP